MALTTFSMLKNVQYSQKITLTISLQFSSEPMRIWIYLKHIGGYSQCCLEIVQSILHFIEKSPIYIGAGLFAHWGLLPVTLAVIAWYKVIVKLYWGLMHSILEVNTCDYFAHWGLLPATLVVITWYTLCKAIFRG